MAESSPEGAPDDAPRKPDADRALASTAGRGVLLIAGAKFWFMISGLIIQLRLPVLLSRAMFGAYGVVRSVVSPVNNVMITGTIQAVSRFTAQKPELARSVERAGLRMHLYVGLPLAILFIASAPVVAWWFQDPGKIAPLMLAGLIVAGYAFYAVLVGTANGRREFHKQAGLDITFSTLRVVGILGMAMAGFGVTGVIGGWVAAAGVIMLFAIAWVGLPGKAALAREVMSVRPLLGYFIRVAIYLALLNALMFADTWLLKKLTGGWYTAHQAALGGALHHALPWAPQVSGFHYDPAQLADVQVAYYTAVQTLARLSYQAIIAVTFVVFPLVSRSTFDADHEQTRRYVHVTMRYSLVFAAAIAVVLAANPRELLGIPYPGDYAAMGAPALAALAAGNVAFAVFAIAGTILNGAGFTRDATLTAALTLVLAVAGNWIVIPLLHPGQGVLLGAAVVTGVAMLIGAGAAGAMMWRRLGAFVPALSVVRVVVAAACAIAVGRVVPLHGLVPTLGEAVLVGLVFLAVLVVTGELGKKDLAAIAAVRRKGGAGGDA